MKVAKWIGMAIAAPLAGLGAWTAVQMAVEATTPASAGIDMIVPLECPTKESCHPEYRVGADGQGWWWIVRDPQPTTTQGGDR